MTSDEAVRDIAQAAQRLLRWTEGDYCRVIAVRTPERQDQSTTSTELDYGHSSKPLGGLVGSRGFDYRTSTSRVRPRHQQLPTFSYPQNHLHPRSSVLQQQ